MGTKKVGAEGPKLSLTSFNASILSECIRKKRTLKKNIKPKQPLQCIKLQFGKLKVVSESCVTQEIPLKQTNNERANGPKKG